MDQNNASKRKRLIQKVNPLEAMRDFGENPLNTISREILAPLGRSVSEQVFGLPRRQFHGEIGRGETLEMSKVLSGKQNQEDILKKQLVLERRLREEEKILIEKRGQELSLQIHAVQEEVIKLVAETPRLNQEIQIAAMQSQVEPSIYELNFFHHLLDFIASFRKKVESARYWLMVTKQRAQKKNAWGANYKKYGAKYLLSGEHYVSRSAG